MYMAVVVYVLPVMYMFIYKKYIFTDAFFQRSCVSSLMIDWVPERPKTRKAVNQKGRKPKRPQVSFSIGL